VAVSARVLTCADRPIFETTLRSQKHGRAVCKWGLGRGGDRAGREIGGKAARLGNALFPNAFPTRARSSEGGYANATFARRRGSKPAKPRERAVAKTARNGRRIEAAKTRRDPSRLSAPTLAAEDPGCWPISPDFRKPVHGSGACVVVLALWDFEEAWFPFPSAASALSFVLKNTPPNIKPQCTTY
jgi:hypothetical protein